MLRIYVDKKKKLEDPNFPADGELNIDDRGDWVLGVFLGDGRKFRRMNIGRKRWLCRVDIATQPKK